MYDTERKKGYYLRDMGGAAQPKLPLLNLPLRLVSVLATPVLLNHASSPEVLLLLDLGDAGPMAVQS
jgi:hypothetical protein